MTRDTKQVLIFLIVCESIVIFFTLLGYFNA